MVDADLVAYLDGEADADASAVIERRLREEPQLREEALALMRQRVALSRVLPELALRQRAERRRPVLRFVVPLTAAAAAIVAAVVVATRSSDRAHGTDVAVAKPPPVAPAPTVAAAWKPGTVVAGDGKTTTLADGTRLTLASGASLRVPETGGRWELVKGTLRGETRADASAIAGGIVTAEAEVRPGEGRWLVARDDDGTLVRVDSGTAAVRDSLTSRAQQAAPAAEAWIPSDTVDPTTTKDAKGIVRGAVASVTPGGMALVLHGRFGDVQLTPNWIGDGRSGGLDRDMTQRLVGLNAGDRIAVSWERIEHLRVTDFRRIVPAGDHEPIGAFEHGDFAPSAATLAFCVMFRTTMLR